MHDMVEVARTLPEAPGSRITTPHHKIGFEKTKKAQTDERSQSLRRYINQTILLLVVALNTNDIRTIWGLKGTLSVRNAPLLYHAPVIGDRCARGPLSGT